MAAASTDDAARPWMYAGTAASLPDIDPVAAGTSSVVSLSGASADGNGASAPCWVLVPSSPADTRPLQLTPCEETLRQTNGGGGGGADTTTALVFRRRGRIHAVDHECPHAAHPLSRGAVCDVEDFGVVLSAAISCPKHGWAFDLFTGESDRGAYRLGVWEVETRDNGADEEVWVRRKPERRGRVHRKNNGRIG